MAHPSTEVTRNGNEEVFWMRKGRKQAGSSVSVNAEVYVHRAEVRLVTGNPDGALADCEEAIRLDPDMADAYKGRAAVLLALSDFKAALADLGKAIQLDSTDAVSYRVRWSILRGRSKRAEAEADWATAMELEHPDHLSGKVVTVADGDTLTVLVDQRETKVRVSGIDCPVPVQRVYMTHLGGSIRRSRHPIEAHKLAGRGQRPWIADNISPQFAPMNLGDWFYERVKEWSAPLPKGTAYTHVFRKTSLQYARSGEDINRQVAADARLSESVLMASYARETDQEMRQRSNRTYLRIANSLPSEAATRYGYIAPTVDPIVARLKEAVAANNWPLVASISAELERRERGRNVS